MESSRQVLSFNQPTWGKEPNDKYELILADANRFLVAVEHKPSDNVEAGEDGGAELRQGLLGRAMKTVVGTCPSSTVSGACAHWM